VKLRELFEERKKKVVAVMPGGFHPFHPGHKSLYDWAVDTFGKPNVYVAATDDTKSRPFPFAIKQKLAAMAGVPTQRFIQVKSPFNALSYTGLLSDPENTALVFVRSEKDQTSHPKPDQIRKSDGQMGYIISYNGELEHGADMHGYMTYGPTIDFNFSGMDIKSASELRATWPEMDDESKAKAAELMYPGNGETASKLLNDALGDPEVPAESIQEGDNPAPNKIKPIKMSQPPKAPDATIPRSRDGHTKSDGTMYKQDKYNDNIMHVSNGGGTYTFDGSRLIRWKTPKINGYSQIHDFIKSTITVDANTSVTTKNPGPGTSTTVVDTNAVYDLKGNLIDKGELGIRYGGLGVSQSDKKIKINYNISPNLSMHIVADRKPVTPKVKQSMDAIVKSPNKDGTASNLIKIPMMAKKAGAKVIFKNSQGQSVPYDQAIAMLKKGKP
jgi:hypothetical protein